MDNPPREAFNDASFSNTRLTDQNHIVLSILEKRLRNFEHLRLPPDQRWEFVVAGELVEIASELRENGFLLGRIKVNPAADASISASDQAMLRDGVNMVLWLLFRPRI